MKQFYPMILFLFSALAICAQQQQPDKSGLDRMFDMYEAHDMLYGNVLLQKNGENIYARSVGYRNLEQELRTDSETVFLVGSVAKTYTAVIILQLIEEGKLYLNEKLSVFYPGITNAGHIDIEMLLRHRSGIYNYTDAPAFLNEVSGSFSKEAFIKKVESFDEVFPAGAKYEYSNTNYMLLGFIIEDVTGNSYEKELQSRILKKLNLTHTTLGRPHDKEHFAFAYTNMGYNWLPTVPHWNTQWVWSAGAIATTLDELAEFYHALFGGMLLSDEGLNKMMEIEEGYGMGLIRFPYYKKLFYGHGGGIESYRSMIGYNPDDGILMAYSFSAVNGVDLNEIAVQLLNAVYGKEVEIPVMDRLAVEVEEEVLKIYEGNYGASNFPLDIRVFLKEGHLFGQATGQSAFPLTSYSKTEFEYKPARIKIKFFKKDGVQSFYFDQAGRKLEFSIK